MINGIKENIDSIIDLLGSLKSVLEISGEAGFTDRHKICENLAAGMLNNLYGYRLKNMNQDVSNFPELDLGDSVIGLGVQVTAENDSAKINETLVFGLMHSGKVTMGVVKG